MSKNKYIYFLYKEIQKILGNSTNPNKIYSDWRKMYKGIRPILNKSLRNSKMMPCSITKRTPCLNRTLIYFIIKQYPVTWLNKWKLSERVLPEWLQIYAKTKGKLKRTSRFARIPLDSKNAESSNNNTTHSRCYTCGIPVLLLPDKCGLGRGMLFRILK